MSNGGLDAMYPSPVGARVQLYALAPGPSQHVCLTASWRMLPIGSVRYPLRSDGSNMRHFKVNVKWVFEVFCLWGGFRFPYYRI